MEDAFLSPLSAVFLFCSMNRMTMSSGVLKGTGCLQSLITFSEHDPVTCSGPLSILEAICSQPYQLFAEILAPFFLLTDSSFSPLPSSPHAHPRPQHYQCVQLQEMHRTWCNPEVITSFPFATYSLPQPPFSMLPLGIPGWKRKLVGKGPGKSFLAIRRRNKQT